MFDSIYKAAQVERERVPDPDSIDFIKESLPYACNLYLGHVRYGTFGNYNIDYVHPVTRENNWRSRNIVLAGNFNLTNVDELFSILVDLGQYPKDISDTGTILEKAGHFKQREAIQK